MLACGFILASFGALEAMRGLYDSYLADPQNLHAYEPFGPLMDLLGLGWVMIAPYIINNQR